MFCLHLFHCVLRFTVCSRFVNFVPRAILSERLLSLDLTGNITFSGAIALVLGLATIECFYFECSSLFLAGAIFMVRFSSHRLLWAMYCTFHVLPLPNVNVIVPVCFASLSCSPLGTGRDVSCVATIKHDCRSPSAFCILKVAPRNVLDVPFLQLSKMNVVISKIT